MNKADSINNNIPHHIAVVMDGNGRWANERFLPRTAGHKAGVTATRNLVENCLRYGIEALTVFAFSSENWSRPGKEVDSLMSLFVSTLTSEINKLHQQNIRVRFIGDRNRFSEKLQTVINKAETITRDNSGLKFNIAANYGGRWDILNAVKNIASRIDAGEIQLDELTEDVLSSEIALADLSEPDLFIRTGGEKRISNFLIWQLAYTELYFLDTLWPAFDDKAFEVALTWFSARQRRFGRTAQQVEDREKNRDQQEAG